MKAELNTGVADTGYRPRDLQQVIHYDETRFKVMVCHRRFGKTVMSICEMIDQALRFDSTKYEDPPQYAYIAKTYKQAKRIAWDYFKKYLRPLPNMKFNESELTITFLDTGAKIFLAGADNAGQIDSLRGIYLDGVIVDEFGNIPPQLWSEVLRPALSDRKGWAWFIGTPAGKNHFYDVAEYAKKEENIHWAFYEFKASKTGYIDPEELEQARSEMTEDEFDQEFECSFEASVRGSIYGKWIREAYDQKRICPLEIDPYQPVYDYWDLGASKKTASNVIWFIQVIGDQIRFVDCYAAFAIGFDEYAAELESKGYTYGGHYAPHDVNHPAMGTGKTAWELAKEAGIEFKEIAKQSEQDRIANTRRNFHRFYFNSSCPEVMIGLNAVSQYKEKWDDKGRCYRGPEHDWTSHYADSLGYAAWETPDSKHIGVSGGSSGDVVGDMGDWDVGNF